MAVQVTEGRIAAEGPKGRLTQPVPPPLGARVDNGRLGITRTGDERRRRAARPAA